MNSFIISIFHTSFFAIYAFTIYYDLEYTVAPPGSRDDFVRKTIAGRFKFLTFINASILQLGFFGLCIVNDFFGSNSKQPSKRSFLQKFCDFAFTSLVLPIGVFVCATFWGLYAIDRDLIYGREMDTWIPKWVNHSYHTLPCVAVLLEMIMAFHHFQKGSQKYFPVIMFVTGYIVWVFYIAYKIKFWIYPVFEVLSFPMRIAFVLALSLPPLLFIYLGERMQNMFWGIAESSKKKSSGKKQHSKAKKK